MSTWSSRIEKDESIQTQGNLLFQHIAGHLPRLARIYFQIILITILHAKNSLKLRVILDINARTNHLIFS
ncbi:MAG: hypothetical protein L3J69_16500 [Desulfobacula sp.]|nr:hypothetical protein [Desulfobacula sp.]